MYCSYRKTIPLKPHVVWFIHSFIYFWLRFRVSVRIIRMIREVAHQSNCGWCEIKTAGVTSTCLSFIIPEYSWQSTRERERERMCSRVCVYVCECVRSHLSPLCNYRFSKPEAYCDSINLWFVGWKDTDGNEVCVRECVGPHTSVDEPYICITECIILLSSRYVRHGTRYEYEYMYVWCVSECVCV